MKNKFEIITASITKELIISETGLQVQPHIELNEVRVEEYEGIIIPGGDAIHMKDAEVLFSVIRQFHEQEKLVAAIYASAYGDYGLPKIRLFSSRKFCL